MSQLLTNEELIGFCRQMAMVFHSGISAPEGIELMLQSNTPVSENYRDVLEKLKVYMDEMGFFSFAIKETESFPEYVESMTELGERTGNLDEVMESLAVYYEREVNLLADIKNACVYPLVMTAMMLVILLVLLVKVIPVFGEVYEQMGSQMTGIGRIFLLLGNGIRTHLSFIMIAGLVIAGVVIWVTISEKGKKESRKVILRFLRKSQVFYKVSLSRFALIVSMTLRSGMDYDTAFSMVKKFMGEEEKLMGQVMCCERMLMDGSSMGLSCQESGLFDGMQAQVLLISEQAGRTEEALQNISKELDEEVSDRINAFISKLEPSLVAVLSIMVGLILLSVMMPLMGILANIG